MRFTTSDGRLFSVTFNYDGNVPTEKRRTSCTIRRLADSAQKAEDGQSLATSTVRQSNKDPDNKFVARKYALAGALRGAKFNKKFRSEIWNAYFTKVRTPKDRSQQLYNIILAIHNEASKNVPPTDRINNILGIAKSVLE